jgi:hypothetical protein
MALATGRAKMNASRFRSLYGQRGYRPQSVTGRALGEIRLKPGRAEAEGVPFNLFPYLSDRVPEALGEIVVETTEEVARLADDKVPIGKDKGKHKAGTLKRSQRIIYYRSRQTGTVVTGRIDYLAQDPDGSGHYYGFYVEVGTSRTPAQPFLLPSLISQRQPFNEKCRNLESRL